MEYKISKLSEQVYFIQWLSTPKANSESEISFYNEIKGIVEKAAQPIYFITDLRRGRIANIELLRRIGATVARHPNWGGGVSFSNNPLTTMYAEAFHRFAKFAKREDGIYATPEEAILFLESLKEGLTKDIAWDKIITSEV
jgi:hypothetical protein